MEGESVELKVHVKVQRKNGSEYKLVYLNFPSKIGRLLGIENKMAVLDPKANCILLMDKQSQYSQGVELKINVRKQKKGDKEYKLFYLSIPYKIGKLLDIENKVAVLDPKTNCIVFKEKTLQNS